MDVTEPDVTEPLDDSVEEDETFAVDEVPAPVVARRDPVTAGLLVVALVLIVALLVTSAAVYVYLTTLNRTPRTTVERDISSGEAATSERPEDVAAWSELAYAYARAGRTDDALGAVERGEKAQNGESLSIVRADVLRYSGQHKEAVRAYNTAEKLVVKMFERQKTENAKIGVSADLTDDSLGRVYWGRALSKEQSGDLKGAVADLEKSVAEQPTQASVWAKLGDLYAQLEQPDKAREAYQSALKYIPDMPDALEGLERLEKAGE